MNIKKFEKYIQIYGPDYFRWEGVDCKDVETFLENSIEAQNILKEEKKMSSVLDAYSVPHVNGDISAMALEKIDKASERAHVENISGHNVVANDQYYAAAFRWVIAASCIVLLCGSIIWFVDGNNFFKKSQDRVIASNDPVEGFFEKILEDIIEEEMQIEDATWLLAVLGDDNLLSEPNFFGQGDTENLLIEEFLKEWEDQEFENSQDPWELFMEENGQQG